MKKRIVSTTLLILLMSLSLSFSFAADIPKPTNNFYVNDFADILSDETEQTIMNTSVPLAEKTGAQIVVVTVDSLDGVDIESYAYDLFKSWGIGDAKKNNGLLLLIAYDDRRSRIEVGYGLEGALNDAKTGRIQDDYLIGNFQAGDYDGGVIGTYLKLAEEVFKEYEIDSSNLDSSSLYYMPSEETSSDSISIGEILIGIIVVIFIILDVIFNRGRVTRFVIYMAARSSKGGKGGGGFSGGGGRSGGGGSSRSW